MALFIAKKTPPAKRGDKVNHARSTSFDVDIIK